MKTFNKLLYLDMFRVHLIRNIQVRYNKWNSPENGQNTLEIDTKRIDDSFYWNVL